MRLNAARDALGPGPPLSPTVFHANLVPGTDMPGAPGYGTAPPQPEQWGTFPDLPGGAQYPIRPNDYSNGAVFGTQPDLGHFGPFNTTPLDPNGPPAHSGGQSPSTFYPGYDMTPEDANPGSSSNWFQAP